MRSITKIKLARLLYQAFHAGRALANQGNQVTARRGGILWNLDLQEGIDFSIYVLGVFERSTVRTLKALVKEGDTVLDIGANIGAHTLHLAQSVGSNGHVFAFEPTNFAFSKLRANLALNPMLASVVTAEQIFLTAGEAKKRRDGIYASWPLTGESGLHQEHGGRLMASAQATEERLDDYVERKSIARIDVIKMDVDGHELPALKGARECLKRFRPRIVAELAPYTHEEENSSFDGFIELLKEMKYLYRDHGEKRCHPLDALRFKEKLPRGYSMNVVLEPR